MEPHAAGALDDGFDDDRGEFVTMRHHQGLESATYPGSKGAAGRARTVAGRGTSVHIACMAAVRVADAHRCERSAVVSAAPR